MSQFSFCQLFFLNKKFFLSFSWNAHLCFINCRCLPLIAHSLCVFLHMKNCENNLVFAERKGLILLRKSTGKTGKKKSVQQFADFLICTHVFTAIAAKVLPEQERILSHTSVWMSLKGDLSNYSMIQPFQDGLFISSQLITTHLAWLVLLQPTNRKNRITSLCPIFRIKIPHTSEIIGIWNSAPLQQTIIYQ